MLENVSYILVPKLTSDLDFWASDFKFAVPVVCVSAKFEVSADFQFYVNHYARDGQTGATFYGASYGGRYINS